MRRNDVTNSDYTDYSYAYELQYHILHTQDPVAYAYEFGQGFYDNLNNPINFTQRIAGKDGYKMSSHELRVTTPKDLPLRATFGWFTARQIHQIEQRYVIDGQGPTGLGLADTLSVTYWPNTYWLTKEQRINRDYALFAEASYDITSQLTGSVGLRHFEWKNSLEGFYGFANRTLQGSKPATDPRSCKNSRYINIVPISGAPCTNISQFQDATGNTPKVNLTYKFDPMRMVYATYAKGFRPGGVNRVGTVPPYKSDFLTSYELGWKTSWLGNTLRFNGAFFWENWKDFQYAFLGPNSVTVVANAGNARIKGMETQLEWAASDSLTLSGGFQLLFEAKALNDVCTTLNAAGSTQQGTCVDLNKIPVPIDVPANSQLPTTPKFKGDLTARYHFAIGEASAHLQAAYVYQSEVLSDLRPAVRVFLHNMPAYGLLDLTFGVDKGPYSVELFVNNALDKRAEIYRYTECTEAICGGVGGNVYSGIYAPRMIGVKFGQKF